MVAGYYVDANIVAHGFERSSSGVITTFDEPQRGFQCFVCKESIAPHDKHGCTVMIHRRLITSERQIKSPQFIWAHDHCLVGLIPLAEYTFPGVKQ